MISRRPRPQAGQLPFELPAIRDTSKPAVLLHKNGRYLLFQPQNPLAAAIKHDLIARDEVVLDGCCQGILGLEQQVAPVLVQQDSWFRSIPYGRELERQLPGLGPWPPANHWRLSPTLGKSPSLNGNLVPVDA